MRADEILVLDNGHISERGTHEQLLSLEGWYDNMFRQQQLDQKISESGEDNE